MADIPTIEGVKKAVSEFLLLGDDGIVEAIIATVIANKLDLDAVWLMVVAGSSSGKTELLNPLFDLKFIIPISDLTVNTFASGFKMGGGKQSSLLLKHQNGILVFKDFTSILSKSRETRDAVMSQMREIYEGRYDKHTGTGEEIKWQGKMGAIAASTGAVYVRLDESTEMGQRFIYYNIKQPNRRESAKRAQQNSNRGGELRKMLAEEYKQYINFIFSKIEDGDVNYELPAEIADEMLDIADFACLARSPVPVDFKSGLIAAKPDPEMPGRVTKQLCALASAFMVMNHAEQKLVRSTTVITDHQRHILYRCAFDSIPAMRRHVLRLLAEHRQGVTTAGAATALNLPTDSVKKFLYQVNALGICKRRKEAGNKGDKWVMDDDTYRDIVLKLEDTVAVDDILIGTALEDDSVHDDEGGLDAYQDADRAATELFDGV